VKKYVVSVKKPLTDVCNASLETGILPYGLKLGMVKSLHRNGDTENIQNYRPISLLSVFSKILEKLMYTRLIAFITKSNILTETENGFREGK
jgi:hypothetical protein